MHTVIESILAFAFVLGVLVFIHEFGHFIVARLLRIKVTIFSFGFGTRLFGFRGNETDYRVSLIPLGGYVRMAGDTPEEHDPSDGRQFLSRPRFQRFLVIVTGAIFNIVLAILLTTFIFVHGIEVPSFPDGTPVVDAVKEGSPASQAGVQPGDRILEFNGEKVKSLADFTQTIFLSPNTTANLLIERKGERIEKSIHMIENPDSKYREGYTGMFFRIAFQITQVIKDSPAERAGLKVRDRIIGINGTNIDDIQKLVSKIHESAGTPIVLMVKRDSILMEKAVTPTNENGKGVIGVQFGLATEFVRKSIPGAFAESVRSAYSNATLLFETLKNLLRGKLSMRVFSGPIEIASISGESYRQGPIYFIYFIALVSLQLGIINLLPIPVLDGGQIFILIVEGIVRRDLNMKVKEIIIQVGFILLLLFTAVVIYYDIIKSFFS